MKSAKKTVLIDVTFSSPSSYCCFHDLKALGSRSSLRGIGALLFFHLISARSDSAFMRKVAFVLYRLEMAIYFERLGRACAGTMDAAG